MLVVTKLEVQEDVTWSRSASGVGKDKGLGDELRRVVSDADFSTDGVDAGRPIASGVKPCWAMRYSATEFLPAQRPISVNTEL